MFFHILDHHHHHHYFLNKKVATDTQKNTVYIVAKRTDATSPEQFGVDIAKHFMDNYPILTACQIDVEETLWCGDCRSFSIVLLCPVVFLLPGLVTPVYRRPPSFFFLL